ncbi:MAG: glutamate 5-kinase [Clostridiales bacterium]|nr:glutamate 5-kinase [Clostridiales bacterium]
MSILSNKRTKRYVVKVGTSTLTHGSGKLNLERIEKLVRVISDIKNMGHEIVLVSSGAIGVGVGKLGLKEKPESVRMQQALAAIGQASLVSIYDKIFKEYGYSTGQVLLTKFILDEETRYNCARRAFDAMISLGVIPIVNENDVISTYEIEFGDNDTLSAYVAELVRADLLVILSDIDGFYDSDPRINKEAKVIPIVNEITDELKACAGAEGTSRGTGGMKTKLKAAKFVNDNGIDMILTNGSKPENLYRIINGQSVGTLFKHSK